MLQYEDYLTTKWKLNTGTASNDVIRSEFDYGARQRRALRGYDRAGVSVYLTANEVMIFKKFWLDLSYGAEKFLTDMNLFGDPTLAKTVRFTAPYTLREIGCNLYLMTTSVELVKTSINEYLDTACPLSPSPTLLIGVPRVPCGAVA